MTGRWRVAREGSPPAWFLSESIARSYAAARGGVVSRSPVTVTLSSSDGEWQAVADGKIITAGCESRMAAGVTAVNTLVGTFLHEGAGTVSVRWVDDLTVVVGA